MGLLWKDDRLRVYTRNGVTCPKCGRRATRLIVAFGEPDNAWNKAICNHCCREKWGKGRR
jgi:formamidopyrimidine-DNA glycosylase